MKTGICTAVALGMLGLASSANAALIAYEGFDYANSGGTLVTGLNGGTGWTEAYPTGIRIGNSFAFTGLTGTTGLAMERNSSETLTNDGRNWAATIATGTYYYSFAMFVGTDGAAFSRGTFGVLQNSSGSNNQDGFGIRFDFTGTSLTVNAQTHTQAPGANVVFADGFNKSYFVIGKLVVDTAANTTNSIWVYQDGQALPTTEPGVVMSSVTGAAAGGSNPAMYGRAFGNSRPTFFDEVRIGTDFADVIPAIPEPASFGLLAIGASLLAFRRSSK